MLSKISRALAIHLGELVRQIHRWDFKSYARSGHMEESKNPSKCQRSRCVGGAQSDLAMASTTDDGEQQVIDGGRTVVLHLDLDCFYAAVEHARLGIPTDKPLAVQQWEGLIAVNYAARAAGIVRHDRVKEALKKCPELQLVHVETVGDNETHGSAPSRSTSKVSLERYRQASVQVFLIFRRFASVCERASIDEAYLDVTNDVDEMLKNDVDWNHELQRLTGAHESGKACMVVESGPLATSNAYDTRLLAGALIADHIRAAIRDELGYTCSAGIAPNKLLAKIASARNKPDRQTLILPRAVAGLMQNLPLKKIKLLGGKLGEELRDRWCCTTAGEAQVVPLSALVSSFGERLGTYAWKAVRGIQNDKVQVKHIPKSMLAAKSFSATSDVAEIRRWLGVLAEELSVRIFRDVQQNHRQPRIMQLYYRNGLRDSSDHSKSSSMPHAALHLLSSLKCPPAELESSEQLADLEDDSKQDKVSASTVWPPLDMIKPLATVIQEAAFHIFRQLDHTSPYTRLAISASGFQTLPNQSAQSIQRFFPTAAQAVSTGSPEVQGPSRSAKPRGIMKFLTPSVKEDISEDDSLRDHTVATMKNTQDEPPLSGTHVLETCEDPGMKVQPEIPLDLDSIDIAEQHRIQRSIELSQSKVVESKSGDRKSRKRHQVEPPTRSISTFFQPCKKAGD